MDCSDLLEPVIAIAKAAAKAVLEVYSEDFEITEKSDHSPLTRADLQSHHLIVKGLQGLSPHYPILSEEAADIPYEVRSTWSTYWLVDPLDGTKEFIKRNGEFTVNIALIHHHQPLLGVVLAPVPERLYFAAMGQGAYRSVAGQPPVRLQVGGTEEGPWRLIGSRSHGSNEWDRFLETVGPYVLETVGSSLKFCRIAEASADLYPRFGPTSEWDTAAAHAIVLEAGGTVCDLQGVELLYNMKPSLLNPFFLVHAKGVHRWLPLAQSILPHPL